MAFVGVPRLPRLLLLLTAVLAMVVMTVAGVDDGVDEHYADIGEDDDEDAEENKSNGICYKIKWQNDKAVRVSECCWGWKYINRTDEHQLVCEPVCNPPCINGVCKEPMVCECHPRYSKNFNTPRHVCVPQCDPPCLFADCVAVNTCRCKPGYENTKNTRHMCQPVGGNPGGGPNGSGGDDFFKRQNICVPPCGRFSRCVGFKKCECEAGYEPKPGHPGHCQPVCNRPCGVNAFCFSPETCECHQGYSAYGSGTCVPICEGGCRNGTCVAPNECVCDEGFEKFEDKEDGEAFCVPECAPPCGNHSECVEPDRCVCDAGYELSFEGDCVIKCPPGTYWQRGWQKCVDLPPSTSSPLQTQPPSLTPTTKRRVITTRPPPPRPPTPPPPPPAPQTEVASSVPACAQPCINGLCGRDGACECARGWAGEHCSRPCRLLAGSAEFDAGDCPSLGNCTCRRPTDGGKSCAPGSKPVCDQLGTLGKPAKLESEVPKWVICTIAGGIVGALVLFVVVPSAVALQRRHNKQRRKKSQDKEILHASYAPGKGRSYETDNQWNFMPN